MQPTLDRGKAASANTLGKQKNVSCSVSNAVFLMRRQTPCRTGSFAAFCTRSHRHVPETGGDCIVYEDVRNAYTFWRRSRLVIAERLSLAALTHSAA